MKGNQIFISLDLPVNSHKFKLNSKCICISIDIRKITNELVSNIAMRKFVFLRQIHLIQSRNSINKPAEFRTISTLERFSWNLPVGFLTKGKFTYFWRENKLITPKCNFRFFLRNWFNFSVTSLKPLGDFFRFSSWNLRKLLSPQDKTCLPLLYLPSPSPIPRPRPLPTHNRSGT